MNKILLVVGNSVCNPVNVVGNLEINKKVKIYVSSLYKFCYIKKLTYFFPFCSIYS